MYGAFHAVLCGQAAAGGTVEQHICLAALRVRRTGACRALALWWWFRTTVYYEVTMVHLQRVN